MTKIDNAFTPERIAQSREILAKATLGEWEVDTEKTDGEYGSGPDCHSGYHVSIITAGDKRICGTENSSDGEVHEEFDEDGCYAWDEVAACNMKAAAHAVNTLPEALDEIERLSAERDEAQAIAQKWHKAAIDNTIGEEACKQFARESVELLDGTWMRRAKDAEAELARVRAKLDEAVAVIDINLIRKLQIYLSIHDGDQELRGMLVRARSFLSRMEDRGND